MISDACRDVLFVCLPFLWTSSVLCFSFAKEAIVDKLEKRTFSIAFDLLIPTYSPGSLQKLVAPFLDIIDNFVYIYIIHIYM